VVVLGRWDCGPVGLPAVLVPSDGEVWAFDRWPTAAAAVAGRPIGRIPDAATLVVVPAANGCDRLTVVRHRGAPIQLQPGLTP
jgi:hypothetical protein